jgi:hypothetical protein
MPGRRVGGVDGFERVGAVGDRGAVDQADEFGEDVEFEFELDAVEEALEGFLEELVVQELEDDDDDLDHSQHSKVFKQWLHLA